MQISQPIAKGSLDKWGGNTKQLDYSRSLVIKRWHASISLVVGTVLFAHPVQAEWILKQTTEFTNAPTAMVTAEGRVDTLGVYCSPQAGPSIYFYGPVGDEEPTELLIGEVGSGEYYGFPVAYYEDAIYYGTPPAPLIETLISGRAAHINLRGNSEVTVTLDGSARTITQALDDCPEQNSSGASASNAPQPAVTGVDPTPLPASLMADICVPGTEPVLGEDAVREVSVDGDNVADVWLNGAGVSCPGSLPPLCGSEGCTQMFFLSAGSDPDAPDLSITAFDIEIVPTPDGRAEIHAGARCPHDPQAGCTAVFAWSNGKIVRQE